MNSTEVECPHCKMDGGGPHMMRLEVFEEMPIWICDECPNVLFEYLYPETLDILQRYFNNHE